MLNLQRIVNAFVALIKDKALAAIFQDRVKKNPKLKDELEGLADLIEKRKKDHEKRKAKSSTYRGFSNFVDDNLY